MDGNLRPEYDPGQDVNEAWGSDDKKEAKWRQKKKPGKNYSQHLLIAALRT